jgi:hypothetical protein
METPVKPLETFDFATSFEAKTFTLVVEKNGDDHQRYAYLVQGWQPMLEAVAQEVFRHGPEINDHSRWLQGGVDEILDVLGQPGAWEWATSSDGNPFRCVFETGPGLTGNGSPLTKVTILRLFENALERVVFQHGFPGGRRPGEAEEDDDEGFRGYPFDGLIPDDVGNAVIQDGTVSKIGKA